MQKFATKNYVDEIVSRHVGAFVEYFDGKIQLIIERFDFSDERFEQFELETVQNFKQTNDRFITMAIDFGNFQREMIDFKSETREQFKEIIDRLNLINEKI